MAEPASLSSIESARSWVAAVINHGDYEAAKACIASLGRQTLPPRDVFLYDTGEDPDAQPAWCLEKFRLVRACRALDRIGVTRRGSVDAVECYGCISNAAGYHQFVNESGPILSDVRSERNAPPGRLETDKTALTRRIPDRSAA